MPLETPTAPMGKTTPSGGATAEAKKEETRARAAEVIAGAATGAGRKGGAANRQEGDGANSQISSEAGLPRKKRTRCPVFGCTRKHALDRVSFETSFDSKQPKLEPKLVSALSETKRLFRLFRNYTETACFGVSIESNKQKTNRNKPKQTETDGGLGR